jgi:hypothetical protein
MSEEILEKIIKEKISADHLLYVSMKYTKTCDVMINLIKRWKTMIEYSLDAILDKAKKKKMIKVVPSAPRMKIEVMRDVFKKNPEIISTLNEYELFKQIDVLNKIKENEFRKGVCLKVDYQGKIVQINLEKLKEYSDLLERFINYTKVFLTS